MGLDSVFDIAGSGMRAQSIRLNTTSSNIANADSVSSNSGEVYRARHPVFADVRQEMDADMNWTPPSEAGVSVLGIVESDVPAKAQYRPEHPMANADGYIFTPNVNVVEEMANMISSSRSYQMNVEVLTTAKTLLHRTLQLGE